MVKTYRTSELNIVSTNLINKSTLAKPKENSIEKAYNAQFEKLKAEAVLASSKDHDSAEAKAARYAFYKHGGKKEHLEEAMPKYGYGKKIAPVQMIRGGKIVTQQRTVGRKAKEESFETKDYDGNTFTRVPVETALDINSHEYEEAVYNEIQRHNKYAMKSPTGKFMFPTYVQAQLFISEFTGQMSDGKYENTTGIPWEDFSDLLVEVDKTLDKPMISWVSYRPSSKNMRFTDLIWLFDGKDGGNTKHIEGVPYEKWPIDVADVRNVMSKLPTAQIKELIKPIEDAINDKVNIEKKIEAAPIIVPQGIMSSGGHIEYCPFCGTDTIHTGNGTCTVQTGEENIIEGLDNSNSGDFIPGTKIPKVDVQLVGKDGNAFAIMDRVVQAMRRAHVPQDIIEEYQKKSTLGDYNNLLATAMEYANDIGEDEDNEEDDFDKSVILKSPTLIEKAGPRIGKPYSQQMGRKTGEGAGHIVIKKRPYTAIKRALFEGLSRAEDDYILGIKNIDKVAVDFVNDVLSREKRKTTLGKDAGFTYDEYLEHGRNNADVKQMLINDVIERIKGKQQADQESIEFKKRGATAEAKAFKEMSNVEFKGITKAELQKLLKNRDYENNSVDEDDITRGEGEKLFVKKYYDSSLGVNMIVAARVKIGEYASGDDAASFKISYTPLEEPKDIDISFGQYLLRGDVKRTAAETAKLDKLLDLNSDEKISNKDLKIAKLNIDRKYEARAIQIVKKQMGW